MSRTFSKIYFSNYKKSIFNFKITKNLISIVYRAQCGQQLSIVNPYNLVYIAVMYFANNDFILKIIQYNWVYNIVGNLF